MLGHVDEVVVDCTNPLELARFWSSVLGGDVHQRDVDWVYVLPPHWTQLSFQRVPEVKTAKNRVHIDIAVADIPSAVQEAEALGATRVGSVHSSSAGTFQVLLDPEGNEWCVVCPQKPDHPTSTTTRGHGSPGS